MDTASPPAPASGRPVRLQLGQPVRAGDELFGELADIVIDPTTREVTHLVVEPHGQHVQARLVPLWLVSFDDDGIVLKVESQFVRQLARVSFAELVPVGAPVDLGPFWDVAGLDIQALPYWSTAVPTGWSADTDVEMKFDRIPKGDVEIRRTSTVRSSDGHQLGHVDGLVVDDGHVTGVIVLSGLPGLRHHLVVPIADVRVVSDDEIDVGVTRDEFHDLPDVGALHGPHDLVGTMTSAGNPT